jgi:hypothetical protein
MEAGDWRERLAEAVVLYGGPGVMAQFVPREDAEGRLVWRAAKTSMSGGRPTTDASRGEELTPAELLDALRGPLGAD